MSKILILFAHPRFEKSRVQVKLLAAAQKVAGVTIHDLYELYPDFQVNVREEQEALLKNDIILLQHPFYWYSCPPLMKQWIDLVLEHGWAYGKEGNALTGKKMGNVISSGGIREAYQHDGFNRFTIKEFLAPFDQTARLCKMFYLPPFVMHGTHRAAEGDIETHASLYREVLEKLRTGSFTDEQFQQYSTLNEFVSL